MRIVGSVIVGLLSVTNAFVVPSSLTQSRTASSTTSTSNVDNGLKSSRMTTFDTGISPYVDDRAFSLSTRGGGVMRRGNSYGGYYGGGRYSDNSSRFGERLTVQGGALHTWKPMDDFVNRVQVSMETEGGPLDANVDVWEGPNASPMKLAIYSQDGLEYPFHAILQLPWRHGGTVAVRNTGDMTFPLKASVEERGQGGPPVSGAGGRMLQGDGATMTFPCPPGLRSLRILLETEGRPLQARVEVLSGPDNIVQVIDIYSRDGWEFPFYAIVPTNGRGSTVRVINTGPFEFPLVASVEPYEAGPGRSYRGGGRRSSYYGMDGGYYGNMDYYGDRDYKSNYRFYNGINRGRSNYYLTQPYSRYDSSY